MSRAWMLWVTVRYAEGPKALFVARRPIPLGSGGNAFFARERRVGTSITTKPCFGIIPSKALIWSSLIVMP